MKKSILLLTLLIVYIFSYSQVITSTIIQDRNVGKPIYMTTKAGSCGSPDGGMNPTTVNPPNYAWLQANGYCNPASYGTNPTVCWTFIPTSSSVSINSGYSTTGCVNISHGPFTLYGPGCVFISNGLSFTGLTPGLTYTWCMTSAAWGGGPGCIGFTDYCPYYFNNIVLPVDFLEFNVSCYKFKWSTLTETNNDYFTIYHSYDADEWKIYKRYAGGGNSNTELHYELESDNLNGYYKLEQTDYDGKSTELSIQYLQCNNYVLKRPVNYRNILGQVVNSYTRGLIIIYFDDSSTEIKLFNSDTTWDRFLNSFKK